MLREREWWTSRRVVVDNHADREWGASGRVVVGGSAEREWEELK